MNESTAELIRRCHALCERSAELRRTCEQSALELAYTVSNLQLTQSINRTEVREITEVSVDATRTAAASISGSPSRSATTREAPRGSARGTPSAASDGTG